MPETLYHVEIGLPRGFQSPRITVAVDYGSHARQESFQDRYGHIELPAKLNLGKMRVIEVGMVDGQVSKVLFRGQLDATRDICIVLIPKRADQAWFAKTAWVNLRTDTHRTLDRSKYVKP